MVEEEGKKKKMFERPTCKTRHEMGLEGSRWGWLPGFLEN